MLYGFEESIQDQPLVKKRPKRRKSKDNPYTLVIRDDRYFVSFKDGEGVEREVELTEQQYLLFDEFELEDKKEANEAERHYEREEQTEMSLFWRTGSSETPLEDRLEVMMLRDALRYLSSTQHRRVSMYYFEGFSYAEIAKRERCSINAVKNSIHSSLEKLKKFLDDRV